MSRRILFFINPVSGMKNKIDLEKKIIKKCGEQNISFEILFTSKDGDYNFLHDKILNEKITDIAIAGGDGSIRHIVSAVLNVEVNVGIIPLGSGNGLARTVGIPKSVDKAIEVILAGKSSATDVFLINNEVSAHVCGLGFDAKVAHDFAGSQKRGLQSYTKIALRNYGSAKTYPFAVEVEGERIEVEAFLICIANSNQFGNNFKVAPKASVCDGLLDIVIVKKSWKPKVVLSFIEQILAGKAQSFQSIKFKPKNILYFQAKKLKIENPKLASFHIDGDPAETSNLFSIEILPAAYKLIHP